MDDRDRRLHLIGAVCAALIAAYFLWALAGMMTGPAEQAPDMMQLEQQTRQDLQ